jgi:hypothetical protein
MLRATSPDGREWEVRRYRLRLPRWRELSDPAEEIDDPVNAIFSFALTLLLLLASVALLVVELPIALFRAAFTRKRWIEAVCRWPSEVRITWETSRDHERDVEAAVARQLELGYEHLRPANAVRVEMTKPPGFDLLGSD